MKYTEVESAQHSLNAILEREQSPEEFAASVNERLKRLKAKPAKKPRRAKSANASLFSQL